MNTSGMGIFRDFICDIIGAWKAALAGSTVFILIGIAALIKPEILPLPFWLWVYFVFWCLCCAMFQVYKNLRVNIGINMLPIPNLSGRDAIKYILGTSEIFGHGAEHVDNTDDLLRDLSQQAASSNIKIWGKTNTNEVFEQVGLGSNLQEIPAAFWNNHIIELLSLMGKGELKTTATGLNIDKNIYSNLAFNEAQIKYFTRKWQLSRTLIRNKL